MTDDWTFINNEFIKLENADIHISDLAIQRGYGLFDFLRTVDNIPIYIEEHLKRLYHSAQRMRLTIPYSPDELKDIILELMRKNHLPHSGIRITVTGGYSSDAYELTTPNMIITQRTLSTNNDLSPKAIKLMTYDYRRELPDVKTINYIMSIWLQPLIKENGADVLYHHHDIISESPRANFFMITHSDTIVTPAQNILKGITRKKILESARLHFMVDERDITLKELRKTKEAFITSTTKHILPVQQVDDIHFNMDQNPITRKLTELLAGQQEAYLAQANR